MVDLFLCYGFCGALCFLDAQLDLDFFAVLVLFLDTPAVVFQDAVHLGMEADGLTDRHTLTLVLHLADDLLVYLTVKGMALGIVTRVVEFVPEVFHVLVNILRLDLKEERACVCIE